MGDEVGVVVGVDSGLTVVVGVVGGVTSGSAVMTSVVDTVVTISSSTLCTLVTGTSTPLILASLVSNTLISVPDFAVVPANFTPF